MQNSIQLPYPFSTFNLASVFDLAALNASSHPSAHTMLLTTTGSSTSFKATDNFDNAVSQFLFPSTFLSGHQHHQTYYATGNNFVERESDNEKAFLKRVASTGSSFSIDSLLGVNKIIQNSLLIPTTTKEHNRNAYGNYGTNIHNNHDNDKPFKLGADQDFVYNNNITKKKKHPTIAKDLRKENVKVPVMTTKSNSASSSTYLTNHHSKTKSSSVKSNSTYNENSIKSTESEKAREANQNMLRRSTKAKRVRTIFTPEQLERLEAEFERQQYMVGPERLYLASSLHLTEAQVKVWFQNRRIKWRKQHLELQQQRLAIIRSQQIDHFVDDDSCDFASSTPDSPTPTALVPSSSNLISESSMDINYALAQEHFHQN